MLIRLECGVMLSGRIDAGFWNNFTIRHTNVMLVEKQDPKITLMDKCVAFIMQQSELAKGCKCHQKCRLFFFFFFFKINIWYVSGSLGGKAILSRHAELMKNAGLHL